MTEASNTVALARKGAGRPNAEEAERKHGALIEAALEEFAAHGFRGASLRTIAARADISTRTLYNRYPDKIALFAACLDASSKQLLRMPTQVSATGKAAPDDLAGQLRAHVVSVLAYLSQERSRQIASLLFREGSEFDDVRQLARAQFERYQVDPVVEIMENHGLHHSSAREEAIQFVAMAFGEWQRRLLFGGQPMTLAEMQHQAALVVRIFLEGISRMPA